MLASGGMPALASARSVPGRANNVLEMIGNTPIVQLRSVGGPYAAIWGKCEYLNPGGSVKDRIALAMIEAGERSGRLRPGHTTLVEPTSGNTGIGLALVAAVKGYRLILTMPESMSSERRSLLRAYGAEIVLTPDDQTMEGAVDAARKLCKQPDHYMLQQFENPANPQAHRDTTGPELVDQLGRIDAFVSAIGTGGTITGVGEILKRRSSETLIVGVEPARSAVLSGSDPGPHRIQGIGAGFIPKVLNRSVIDRVERVRDEDAFAMKQRLAQEEGVLVGISSGAAVWAAERVARELGSGKVVATVLCDTGERYFSLDESFRFDAQR